MPHSILGNPLTGLRFLRRRGKGEDCMQFWSFLESQCAGDRSEAKAREQEEETRGSQKGLQERKASERPGAAL